MTPFKMHHRVVDRLRRFDEGFSLYSELVMNDFDAKEEVRLLVFDSCYGDGQLLW